MVASFDIDRGPIMEHQYPGAISGDENMLAELMLPDQAHVRAQDWTLFFLHKDAEVDDESEEEAESKSGDNESDGEVQSQQSDADPTDERNRDTGVGEDAEGGEGPPLIYVLNLVNMKHDSSVKRFVIHKSSRYHFSKFCLQRRYRESHGRLYATPFPTHIQGQRTSST